MSPTACTTIAGAVASLEAGEVTSGELVERAIEVADALDGSVGMFLNRFSDTAREAARDIDRRRASGQPVGPLAGVPLGVKDIIMSAEAASTAQSLVLDPAWSTGDAPVVARLRAAGGIVMGKLTTLEYAIGANDPGQPFPQPRNPWALERWAGGSSSGSASAVATGAVLGALGSDTGGSIRMPSAYCGVTGLKPTFGRVPNSGCVPLGYTLDHIGPIARSAHDCALMLSVTAGYLPGDVSSSDESVPDYPAFLDVDLTGLRIGVDRLTAVAGELADPALPGSLDAAIGVLGSLGAQIMDVELPLYAEMTIANTVIMQSEALANHLPDLRVRWTDYSASTRAMIGSGVFHSAADYLQAQRVRRAGQKAVAHLFQDVDLVLTPTASAAAPAYADMQEMLRAIDSDKGGFAAVHGSYWDAAGNPALSVPIEPTAEGLPMAMQLVGRPFDEVLVLKAGAAYQRVTDWHLRMPPWPGHADREPSLDRHSSIG